MTTLTPLAKRYIPNVHHQINEAPARKVPVPCRAMEFLDAQVEQLRLQLAPPLAPVAIPGSPEKDRAHTCPIQFPPPHEQYYAVEARTRQLSTKQGNEVNSPQANAVPKKETKQPSPTAVVEDLKEEPLPTVDSITNLADYIIIFSRLLAEERKAQLLLFERYSQYYINLQSTDAASKWSPHGNHNKSRDPSAESLCVLELPGIADATPPVQPGDILLIRTVVPVIIKKGNKRNPPLHHIVEFTSSVTRVVRDPVYGRDKLVGMWHTNEGDLNRKYQEALHFHQTVYTVDKLPYNVRIVPCARTQAAHLSALAWLARQPNDCLMPLLSPTTAPQLPSLTTHLVDELDNGDVATVRSLSPHSQGSGISSGHSSPQNTPDKQQLQIGQLNVHQNDFCQSVLQRTLHPEYGIVRAPLILTGPAGTGKTGCMLQAVDQILNLVPTESTSTSLPVVPRILVCAPSHTAANVITQRLVRSRFFSKHPSNKRLLFRLLSAERPVATIPIDILPYTRQSQANGMFCLPDTAQELLAFRIIVCTCADAHLLYRLGVTNQQLRMRRQGFERQLQTICQSMGVTPVLHGVNATHFTHLFIDEAAQATETETLIPLSVVVDTEPCLRKVEIALIGDPRQLSPAVYSQRATTAGFGRSWIERLLLRPVAVLGGGNQHMLGPELVTMEDWIRASFRENTLSTFLTLNYRGHPSFLMLPSSLFYYDKLQTSYIAANDPSSVNWCKLLRWIESLSSPVRVDSDSVCVPEELRQKKKYDWPIHFRSVVGNDASDKIASDFGDNSWRNEKEAHAVVEVVMALVEKGVMTNIIGVMAPFRGQVVFIRNLLREKNLGGINVGTIEDFQAVEFAIIILTSTRSSASFVENDIRHRMGIFGQPKRSNVALTRAEHMFIVVSC